MSPSVRDLVLVDERDHALLAQALDSALSSWSARWFPTNLHTVYARGAITSRAFDAQSDPNAPWRLVGDGASPPLWASTTQETRSRVALKLLGRRAFKVTPDSDDWLWSAVDAALQDLYLQIRTALPLSPTAPSQPHRRSAAEYLAPYSGGLTARIEDISVDILVAGPFHSQNGAGPAPSTPTLEPLGYALHARHVPLSITLGSIGVALCDLLALREGDVVRFRNPLDAPLPVSVLPCGHLDSEKSVRTPPTILANLGHIGEHVALRFVSAAKDAAPTASPVKS